MSATDSHDPMKPVDAGSESSDRRLWRWTEHEDALLMEYYPMYGTYWDGWESVLSGRRSKKAITSRAWRLGITYVGLNRKPTSCFADICQRASEAVESLDDSDRMRLVAIVGHELGQRVELL